MTDQLNTMTNNNHYQLTRWLLLVIEGETRLDL